MNDCAICLSATTEGDCKMTCGHVFHPVCIQTWLMYNTVCPICRCTIESCQHGTLADHDATVLLEIIKSQQSTIQSLKTDAQIAEDTVMALHMRMEVLQQSEHQQQQEALYYLLVGTFGDD
jgi:predicted DCC family thiol-disulfide oxidoreductase YuxK